MCDNHSSLHILCKFVCYFYAKCMIYTLLMQILKHLRSFVANWLMLRFTYFLRKILALKTAVAYFFEKYHVCFSDYIFLIPSLIISIFFPYIRTYQVLPGCSKLCVIIFTGPECGKLSAMGIIYLLSLPHPQPSKMFPWLSEEKDFLLQKPDKRTVGCS